MHVFAGRVKIVSHSSCRTSAILKYVCPLQYFGEIIPCNPTKYTMDHDPDFIVYSFMENSIGLKRGITGECP